LCFHNPSRIDHRFDQFLIGRRWLRHASGFERLRNQQPCGCDRGEVLEFFRKNADSGSFLSVPGGQSVSFNPSWDFSTAAPINPLWTITGGNNFSFKLLSSTILLRNSNFLFVSSTGILSSPNFADTPATWSFSTQGGAKDGKFGWSSVATAVPEPGTPAILCVILSGACLVRRRKTI